MSKTKLAGLLAALGLLAAAVPLWAHHSFAAEFDGNKPVRLQGVLTKIEWTNPHSYFYVDVKDESGAVTNWNLELASPNVLIRNGWSRHSLTVGDQVTVEGAQAKDGSQMANARSVVLSDGRKVFAGSAAEGEGAPKP